jgi:hypothetical protein
MKIENSNFTPGYGYFDLQSASFGADLYIFGGHSKRNIFDPDNVYNKNVWKSSNGSTWTIVSTTSNFPEGVSWSVLKSGATVYCLSRGNMTTKLLDEPYCSYLYTSTDCITWTKSTHNFPQNVETLQDIETSTVYRPSDVKLIEHAGGLYAAGWYTKYGVESNLTWPGTVSIPYFIYNGPANPYGETIIVPVYHGTPITYNNVPSEENVRAYLEYGVENLDYLGLIQSELTEYSAHGLWKTLQGEITTPSLSDTTRETVPDYTSTTYRTWLKKWIFDRLKETQYCPPTQISYNGYFLDPNNIESIGTNLAYDITSYKASLSKSSFRTCIYFLNTWYIQSVGVDELYFHQNGQTWKRNLLLVRENPIRDVGLSSSWGHSICGEQTGEPYFYWWIDGADHEDGYFRDDAKEYSIEYWINGGWVYADYNQQFSSEASSGYLTDASETSSVVTTGLRYGQYGTYNSKPLYVESGPDCKTENPGIDYQLLNFYLPETIGDCPYSWAGTPTDINQHILASDILTERGDVFYDKSGIEVGPEPPIHKNMTPNILPNDSFTQTCFSKDLYYYGESAQFFMIDVATGEDLLSEDAKFNLLTLYTDKRSATYENTEPTLTDTSATEGVAGKLYNYKDAHWDTYQSFPWGVPISYDGNILLISAQQSANPNYKYNEEVYSADVIQLNLTTGVLTTIGTLGTARMNPVVLKDADTIYVCFGKTSTGYCDTIEKSTDGGQTWTVSDSFTGMGMECATGTLRGSDYKVFIFGGFRGEEE